MKQRRLSIIFGLFMTTRPYIKLFSLFVLWCSAAVAQPTEKEQLKKLRYTASTDSASRFADQMIQQARKRHDVAFEARIRLSQAYQAYNHGLEAEALKLGRQSFALTTIRDTNTYVKAGEMVAYMLSRQGHNAEALKMAFQVLRDIDSHNWKKQLVKAKICIADLYRATHDVRHALPYSQQAAADALALKDSSAYVEALSNLSNLYSDGHDNPVKNLALATRQMETILTPPYAHFVADSFTRIRYMTNLGRLYILTKQLDKADAILHKSAALAHQAHFNGLEKPALNELLTVKIAQHQYKEGIGYGLQALALEPLSESNRVNQMNLYERLTDAYAGLKNYERAFYYEQLATHINDSLMAADQTSVAAELDAKYKADKRLIVAANQGRELEQQRNFTFLIGIVLLTWLFGAYRFITYRRRKEAEALTEKNEQLARLDAMKSRFFANISHELRTPLTLIMGPAHQLLLQPGTSIGPQEQKLLQSVWHNSKRLLGLVNELLDLGKVEAGSLTTQLQPVTLAPYIQVLYQGYSSAAAYKGISYALNNHIDAQFTVGLDKDKFDKIANNLISNAIKFTPSGSGVTITAAINQQSLVFDVADTGGGINPTDLPHIFDRYYQGSRLHQPPEGGTGIGLALAQEFTELLGGHIEVDNDFGKGVTFRVSIPVRQAAAVPAPEEEKLPEIAFSPVMTPKHNRQLILLVEDHKEMAGHIASVLESQYKVITVPDGAEALQKLQSMTVLPGLIISDVMMPGMDGFTLLAELKKHPVYCSIPVIMLTALADSKNKLKALSTGVDDYITKPFIATELLARAANLLSNAAARSQQVPEFAATIGEEEMDPVAEEVTLVEDDAPVQQPPSPADLLWLSELEVQVRKYTGKTDLNIDLISHEMAISKRQLFRRIKQITGMTPNKYIRTIRLQIAREAIESGRYRTIAEIAYAAGFETPAYFSKLFKEAYGRDVSELL